VNPPGLSKLEYFQGSEGSAPAIEVAEKNEPYIPEVIWSKFTYDEKENKFLSSIGSELEKYVDEMRDQFISGEISFSEWDEYVKTTKDIGVEEYIDIQTAAYERYSSN